MPCSSCSGVCAQCAVCAVCDDVTGDVAGPVPAAAVAVVSQSDVGPQSAIHAAFSARLPHSRYTVPPASGTGSRLCRPLLTGKAAAAASGPPDGRGVGV